MFVIYTPEEKDFFVYERTNDKITGLGWTKTLSEATLFHDLHEVISYAKEIQKDRIEQAFTFYSLHVLEVKPDNQVDFKNPLFEVKATTKRYSFSDN